MNKKGFFATLYDFEFNSFITPVFIRVLYGVGLVVIAVAALGVVFVGYDNAGIWGILFGIVGGLAAALLWTIALRVGAEVAIVAFKAWENTERLLADED